jgi:hypothetical protein
MLNHKYRGLNPGIIETSNPLLGGDKQVPLDDRLVMVSIHIECHSDSTRKKMVLVGKHGIENFDSLDPISHPAPVRVSVSPCNTRLCTFCSSCSSGHQQKNPDITPLKLI